MAITWYSTKQKQTVDVKVTKSSIVLTEAGIEKLVAFDSRFSESTQVRLGWDPDRRLVAVAPAAEGERGAFKIARRGRNENNRTINAAKFFEAFGLTVDESTVNSRILAFEDGIATFELNIRAVVSPRRRRGRAPKSSS